MPTDKQQISAALCGFDNSSLYDAAQTLWNTLGYESQRQPEIYSFNYTEFKQSYNHNDALKDAKAKGEEWDKFHILFQVTDEELRNHFMPAEQSDIFGNKPDFKPLMRSYLFAALELTGDNYSRTALADIARQINRCFAMPLIICFKYGKHLTIAVVNRRENRRHNNRDVLEKVILIKDIDHSTPHRAHIEILFELSIEALSAKYALNNFDDLHKAWAKTLDIQELNERFYKELSNWYFWAVQNVEFPDGEESNREIRNSISVIRLITRIIFVWFMKEKNLIPETLFDSTKIPNIIHFSDANNSSYYKAILQNLFFATLNTEMSDATEDKRRFRDEITGKYNPSFNVHSLYRYEKLFNNPSTAIGTYFDKIPFLNGGLFECLDTVVTEHNCTSYNRIDGFSDRQDNVLKVPDYLFLQETEAEVDLNGIYGTIGKRYKVRGLISILNSYKFTVAENTPIEEEVALDPELLGRVFENLLAAYNPETKATARHDTGSFYTPREIVEFMVDEALLAHLSQALPATTKQQQDDNALRLRLLITYTDAEHLFDDAETDLLINAIDNLKAIDPACGSGAFLMGLLLKMVYVLHKLDPHNDKWKAQQIKKIEEQIKKSREIPDVKVRTEVIEKLQASITDINNTFEDFDYDYSRKLFLIEHCIYGSDIQPIAIQIAKLRFFISLLVDQQKRTERANFGIRALPNLETNLVSADSLISIALEEQSEIFFDNEIDAFKKEIKAIHAEYFTARTLKHKKEIKKREQALRKGFATALKELNVPIQKAELITNWNPYASNAYARFFDPGIMFGLDKLNMVITNPPYIRQEDISNKPALQDSGYKVYNSSSDLYTYFYELAIKMLSPGGIAAFITSNKWLRSKYGTKLRTLLAEESTLHAIIDFGGYQVFESATVDTNILIYQNTPPAHRHKFPFLNIDRSFTGDNLEAYFYNNHKGILQNSLQNSGWTLADERVLALKQKIEAAGKPLKDWNVNIYRGLLTGCNEAFIIDTPTKERLCAEDPKSAEVIKPILRGRDIHRYHYEWAGLWILFIPWHFPLNEDNAIEGASTKAEEAFHAHYPAIYKHLLGFKDKLSKRNKAETGIRYEWYALQRCAATYYDEFEKEKIVWASVGDTEFCLVPPGLYLLDTNYFSPLKDYYIYGLMNSRLLIEYLNSKDIKVGTRAYRHYKYNIETLPIAPIQTGFVDRIRELVSVILATTVNLSELSRKEARIQECSREIDELVFDLYNLTSEEKTIIMTNGL